MHEQRVDELLKRLIYTGYIEYTPWNISLRKGQHEPLITLETHQKIQKRLSEKAHAPIRKDVSADFPLRGFVVCGECDNPLTAAWSKGRNKYHAYYNCHTKGCDSRGKSIRRDLIEGQFEALLRKLKPSHALIGAATQMFEKL